MLGLFLSVSLHRSYGYELRSCAENLFQFICPQTVCLYLRREGESVGAARSYTNSQVAAPHQAVSGLQ